MKLPALFSRLRKVARMRTARSQRVMDDADSLIERFGSNAYEEARTRARDARLNRVIDPHLPADHWDRVRTEIGRRMGRTGLDTATRYLEK